MLYSSRQNGTFRIFSTLVISGFLIGENIIAASDRFTTQNCEELLLSDEGGKTQRRAARWLNRLPQLNMYIDRLSLAAVDDLPSPDEIDPYFAYFARQPGETLAEIEEKVEQALEKQKKFWSYVEAMPVYSMEEIEVRMAKELRRRNSEILTDLEWGALGVNQYHGIPLSDLRVSFFSDSFGRIFLQTRAQEKLLGEVILDTSRLRIGFRNSVHHWQARREYEMYREGRPALKVVNPNRQMDKFLRDQGRVLLLRGQGLVQFGYMFELGALDYSPSELYFSVFVVRKCNRQAMHKNEILFPDPDAESGSLNLCLTDLGVRVLPNGL